MKNLKKVLLSVMLFALVLSLAGCSNFNKVKKAFEKNGWEYVEVKDDEGNDAMKISAELEKGDINATLHTFKVTNGLGYAWVLEFASSKDFDKAFSEDGSETLKGLVKDAQNSDYVNGTCVLVFATPLTNALETFKNA